MAQSREVNRALEIVHWLKEQGLVNNIDYTWCLDIPSKKTLFMFNEENQMYMSMITLKFL